VLLAPCGFVSKQRSWKPARAFKGKVTKVTTCYCVTVSLCGLYSALSQVGKLVVEDITLVGLCFGKVGGVISCLFGLVRGYHRMGPQCLLTPPVFMLQ
jgi:hypothetical protein